MVNKQKINSSKTKLKFMQQAELFQLKKFNSILLEGQLLTKN